MSSIPIPTGGETARGDSLEMFSPNKYNGLMPRAVSAKSVTTQATTVRRSSRLQFSTAAFWHFQPMPKWLPAAVRKVGELPLGTATWTESGLAAGCLRLWEAMS